MGKGQGNSSSKKIINYEQEVVQGKQNVKAKCPKDKLDVFSNPANAHLYFGCNVTLKYPDLTSSPSVHT